MADTVIPFVRRDGTAEFTCTGCGVRVHRFLGIGPALCSLCLCCPELEMDENGKISVRELPA